MEVDPELKDLVTAMLHTDFEMRLGTCVEMPDDEGGLAKNVEIRAHPFMRKFPWKKMGERTLAVSTRSACDLSERVA